MTQTHPPRTGPRPLPLHLATATSGWISSRNALQILKDGSANWRPELAEKAASLKAALEQSPEDQFPEAVDREIQARLTAFSAGVSQYQNHPYQRNLEDPDVIWEGGAARLLDYGPATGKPVLFIPSLVNKAYILDLSERRSLLRWMAAETGLRPLLMDWGTPGPVERQYSLTNYIKGPLESALTEVRALSDGPVPVVGYCMGGLLALALAAERPADISGLVMLATPWDFHTERVAQAGALAQAIKAAAPLLEATGELPVDIIQSLFSALDPFLVPRKFVKFAKMNQTKPAAEDFVALEDWLNDGVPLAGPVATECMGGWYGNNTPRNATWQIAGRNVDPRNIYTPTLVLVPQHDRIVPPASAYALADALPAAESLTVRLGHIGMVAADQAQSVVWEPLSAWLNAH